MPLKCAQSHLKLLAGGSRTSVGEPITRQLMGIALMQGLFKAEMYCKDSEPCTFGRLRNCQSLSYKTLSLPKELNDKGGSIIDANDK